MFSNTKDIACGAPQGMVLGLLLCNIYMNDLFQVMLDETILASADDIVLYHEDRKDIFLLFS